MVSTAAMNDQRLISKEHEWSALFAQGTRVDQREIRGKRFAGEILAIGLGKLGQWLFVLSTGWLSDLFKWSLPDRARHFEMRFFRATNDRGQDGINHWPARGEILPYRLLDTNPLRVCYKVRGNWPLKDRPYLDELVRLSDGRILGKFFYRILGLRIFLMWFELRQTDEPETR